MKGIQSHRTGCHLDNHIKYSSIRPFTASEFFKYAGVLKYKTGHCIEKDRRKQVVYHIFISFVISVKSVLVERSFSLISKTFTENEISYNFF